MRRVVLMLGLAAAMTAAGCEMLEDEGEYYYEHSGPDEITTPPWAERAPTAQQIYQAYPSNAVVQGVTARVILLCTVAQTRALSCAVENEGVPGWGFGAAALKVSQLFLVKQGAIAVGQQIRVPIRFEVMETE